MCKNLILFFSQPVSQEPPLLANIVFPEKEIRVAREPRSTYWDNAEKTVIYDGLLERMRMKLSDGLNKRHWKVIHMSRRVGKIQDFFSLSLKREENWPQTRKMGNWEQQKKWHLIVINLAAAVICAKRMFFQQSSDCNVLHCISAMLSLFSVFMYCSNTEGAKMLLNEVSRALSNPADVSKLQALS